MLRVAAALVLTGSILVACADAPSVSSGDGSNVPSGGVPTSPSAEETRLDVYGTLLRHVVGAEGPEWDDVVVVTRICGNAADAFEPKDCGDAFDAEDQVALRERVPRLADRLRFVDDPTSLYDHGWFDGSGPSVVVVRLGPIEPTGEGVKVGASYGCGGLCGSGTTYLLESSPDGWAVVGTTGSTWIA
jgi:hypothetical protein